MAKKKLNHDSPHPKQQNPQDENPNLTHQQTSAMEDPKEKLQNLKSLNAMLLKETIERRQQVEFLMQAQKGLEDRFGSFRNEKMDLEKELSVASEERVSLEIQKGLFCVFIDTQMDDVRFVVEKLVKEKGERESEIGLLRNEVNELVASVESTRDKLSLACGERDVLRSDLDNWVKEANGLKKKVIEMENKEITAEEEIRKLKGQSSKLSKQNQEVEKHIVEAKKLKDLAEKKLEEKVKDIEELNVEMEEIVRKKNEIEKEKSGQKVRISKLEKDVYELNEVISSLRKEEGLLRGKIFELEKSYSEAIEKVNMMAMEVDALVEEKKGRERTIERLMEETDFGEKRIKNLNVEMKDKDGMIEKLLREKKEIEDVKNSKDGEIMELHKELDGIRETVSAMKEFIKNQEDRNRLLASEVNHYRDKFEQVELERDNAQRQLDEEEKKCINLRSEVLQMVKKIEETEAQLTKMKCEFENLLKLNKGMEGKVGLLMNEKDLMHKNFLVAQQEIDGLRMKTESARISSDRALAMLKETTSFVCRSNDGEESASITDKKAAGETEPYEAELEMIKVAFRNKETVVEEMKQQVKSMQNSVAEAKKKNGIWAIVSSATTFLAAASVAYVASTR